MDSTCFYTNNYALSYWWKLRHHDAIIEENHQWLQENYVIIINIS